MIMLKLFCSWPLIVYMNWILSRKIQGLTISDSICLFLTSVSETPKTMINACIEDKMYHIILKTVLVKRSISLTLNEITSHNYSTVLCFTALCCIVLHLMVQNSPVCRQGLKQPFTTHHNMILLYYIVLYDILLNSTVLYASNR